MGLGNVQMHCAPVQLAFELGPGGCSYAGRGFSVSPVGRIGWRFNGWIAAGIEWSRWKRQGFHHSGALLAIFANIYPLRRKGLFFTAGIGRSTLFNQRPRMVPRDVAHGPGFITGLGWELRVDRQLYVTPYVRLTYTTQGLIGPVVGLPDGSLLLASGKDATQRSLSFGVALTVR